MKRPALLFKDFVMALLPFAAAVAAWIAWPAAARTHDVQQKLYILNSASDDLTVVDVASNRVIGSIRVGRRPHGVAAPRSFDRLYVSTDLDHALTVIDPIRDAVVAQYPVLGALPNEIDVTSDGRFVYVAIFSRGVYEVFDTVQERIVARIPTAGLPHNVVISPDDQFAYLAPMDRGDIAADKLAATGFPTTLNKAIYVVDVGTHTVVDTIPTGGAPRPIAIHPDGKTLYANIDGLQGFVVLDLVRRELRARIEYTLTPQERAQPSRSHGIAVTPDGREIWTSDVRHGLLFVFDATHHPPRQVARIVNGAPVYWLTITPDGRTLYAASAENDLVTAYDVATRTQSAAIRLERGKGPKRMIVVAVPRSGSPDGGR